MISIENYPVYNHKERPGLGQNHLGDIFYNCFYISLQKSQGSYINYTFKDFIKQYNQYKENNQTCDTCISKSKIFTFYEVDRSAIEKKALQRSYPEEEFTVDESPYYYCPLISELISKSQLTHKEASKYRGDLPAKPISAIIGINESGIYASGGTYAWDDNYVFQFETIGIPSVNTCSIFRNLLLKNFTGTEAERSFFQLWIRSMFYSMELIKNSGRDIYLEDKDLDYWNSKFLNFIFPVPQVWIYVIPKSPVGVDWKQWEEKHKRESLPQRVDFLFTYKGKRHIVELDDIGHYGERREDKWIPSETEYRKTLSDTRWLRRCGFEVHRFTNEEILELYNPKSSKKPDILGFIRLLQLEGIELEDIVLLDSLENLTNHNTSHTEKVKDFNRDDIPF